MVITGYDISSNNPGFGGYDLTDVGFVVIKVSEGAGYRNPLRFVQAAWARAQGKTVAVYHWVTPNDPPAGQVQNFVDACAGLGPFEWWALDEEQPGLTVALVTDIANRCRQIPLFGDREVDYVGQFFENGVLVPHAQAARWWLPDYGPNDGAVHPTTNGARPMIHQFTSAHGLDRNIVLDENAYSHLVGQPAPIPPPAPEDPMADNTFLFKSKAGTLFLFADGKVVQFTAISLVNAINAGRALNGEKVLQAINVEDDAAAELAALAH